MRQTGAAYLQEEARWRGARPRVRAVLYPFELDFRLAPGSGEFVQTVYGGQPGSLTLEEGYSSGSWTSPVLQTFSPFLDRVVPDWQDAAGGLNLEISLRTGATPAGTAAAPYIPLTAGEEFPLQPYFQVKVEFSGLAGPLMGLHFDGHLGLPESEIIDLGGIRVDLARDFSELRAGSNTLVMDNRLGQWLNRVGSSYLQGMDWTRKQLALHHGWELEDGSVAWQLVYQGVLQGLAGMSHGWKVPHRVRLESQDSLAVALKQVIGAPSPTGDRQPFLRGTYLAPGELVDTTPAALTVNRQSGSGSASINVLGTYRSQYPQEYLLEIQTGGEVGAATFRWSVDQGHSWRGSDRVTYGAESPVTLEEGLSVFWVPAIGADLVAGDRWTVSAMPPVYHYQVYGAPFAAITGVYLNSAGAGDRISADPDTGLVQVTGRSGQVDVRVVKDETTHPVDIVTDILAEVGLTSVIDQDSFGLAKSLTPEYTIGVRFENIPAAQAIREIIRRCLYDLWLDFGEIKIRAYLDEE